MDTIKPCCQPAVLQDGHVRHYERVCFIFGQGLCQPFYEIPNVQLYVQLVRKLNATNYMELRREYRRNIDFDADKQLIDSRLIIPLMAENDVAIVFAEYRLTPSPMAPIDTTPKVTQVRANVPPQMFGRKPMNRLTATRATPTRIVRDETATKLTDTRVTPAQIDRNETATKLTDIGVTPAQIVRNETATKLAITRITRPQMVRNITSATKLTNTSVTPAQIIRNDDEATQLPQPLVVPAVMDPNNTGTKSTDSLGQSQMVGIDIITKLVRPTPWVTNKPVPNLAPKAWTRYKCNGIDCDSTV